MRKLCVLIMFNALLYQIYGQTSHPIEQKLTEDLEQIYSKGQIVGFSVAIVNQDGILYEKGFGYSDVKAGKKYTALSIQNIASISKTFIGIALLKAQELGKLNLDDPISKYLPFEITNPHFPNSTITIRHLVTHTSSIKDSARYEKNGYVLKDVNDNGAKANGNFRASSEMISLEDFLKKNLNKDGQWFKKSTFLKSQPGNQFEYSNVAAGLAALVLEKATQTTFSSFTQEYILKPLNMSNSGWFFEDIDFTKHSKLYIDRETEMAFYKLVTYPDGGMITSSNNLGKYLVEVIKGYNGVGTILTKESYIELFKPQLNANNHKERNEKSVYNDEYNMGVFMGMSAKGQIGHTGYDPGVLTLMFFNAITKVGKIIIINTNIDNKEGINEYKAILKKLEEFENKF